MITQTKDGDGHSWLVPSDGKDHEEVAVWWLRGRTGDAKKRRLGEEQLVIRQEAPGTPAVLILTFGQVYDLIKALTQAVEHT